LLCTQPDGLSLLGHVAALGQRTAFSKRWVQRRRRPDWLSGVHICPAKNHSWQQISSGCGVFPSFRAHALDVLSCSAEFWAGENPLSMGMGACSVDSVTGRNFPLHHDGDPAACARGCGSLGDGAIPKEGRNKTVSTLNLLLDACHSHQTYCASFSRSLFPVGVVETLHSSSGNCCRGSVGDQYACAAGDPHQVRAWVYCTTWKHLAATHRTSGRDTNDFFSFSSL